MKTIKQAFGPFVFALSVSVSVSSAAVAVPMVDVVDPDPNVAITYLGSYAFTHDITDAGFVAGVDTLDSALISILLRDSAGNELFKFEIGLGQTQNYSNVNNGAAGETYAFALTAPSLVDLGSDGLINVTIQSVASDNQQFQTGFFFDHSTLTAQVTKASSVPEPASLALLGIGLAGLGAMRRHKST